MTFDRILVPLDGSHQAEAALPAAEALARRLRSELLPVAEPAAGPQARWLPGASSMLGVLERERARGRLKLLAARLRVDGIDGDPVVRDGAPDDAIIDEARCRNVDLIVLVTHGRTGITAWYERSVARRMTEEPGLTLQLQRQLDASAAGRIEATFRLAPTERTRP